MEDLQLDSLNFCRFCLKRDVELELLFEVLVSGVELPKVLMTLAPILILENDGLSEKVCIDCKSNVSSSYTFQQLCVESDKNQRDLLNLPAVENVEMPYINVKTENISDGHSEHDFILDNVEAKFEPDDDETENLSTDILDRVKTYNCKVCLEVFYLQVDLIDHLISHRSENSVENDSQEQFTVKSELSHEKGEINGEMEQLSKKCKTNKLNSSINCEICGNLFEVASISNTKKHKNNCDKCESTHKKLIKMENSTASKTSFSQDEDNNKSDLDELEDDVTETKKRGKKEHTCEICGKIFKNVTNLIRHLNSSVHNTSLKPFQCPECPQRFSTEQLLRFV